MPSYDDDLPTQQEELLLKQLLDNGDEQERLRTITKVKNLVIGSKRCKIAFFRVGTLETLFNLLKDYSTTTTSPDLLIELIDCLSSFAKSSNKTILERLIELGCIQVLFSLLSSRQDCVPLCESSLRCLRSFFLPQLSYSIMSKADYNNPFLTPLPFVLLCDQETHQPPSVESSPVAGQLTSMEQNSPVEILFDHVQFLDILIRLLSTSKLAQLTVGEILCCLCVDNDRQKQLVDREIVPAMVHLLVQNMHENQDNPLPIDKITLVSLTNDYIIGVCLKFFCALSYENASIAHRLHHTVYSESNQTLSEIISSLLSKTHRPIVLSYYAAKYFVHLCKSKVLDAEHPSVSLESLSTLIHLCTKSILNKCVYLYIECLETLIYLLNGNSTLHHRAIYNEQLLSKLFLYFFTPAKILDESVDESVVIQIRASALTLLAVLASHHEDIKKRIAEQENLISKATECCRSSHLSLQLAAFRLFHGLSRSVPQLRTTFNDTICDILLDAIQSADLSLVKISSCVISNIVLEFSTCRTRLLNGGILAILFGLLTHSDHDLRINSIWALRNLSYLSSLKIKQDIINGLTIDRIYSLLENCVDEQFLLCLLSLLRNLLDEKDTDTLLPMLNSVKLLSGLQRILERKTPEKIRQEVNILIEHLHSSANPSQQRLSSETVNASCRTSLFPEYACDEMDQLDCS